MAKQIDFRESAKYAEHYEDAYSEEYIEDNDDMPIDEQGFMMGYLEEQES